VEVLRSFWRAQADPKQTRPREKLQLNLEGGFAYSTMAEEGEGLPPGAASRPRTRGATVGAAGGARGAAAWLARAGTASAARRWGRSGSHTEAAGPPVSFTLASRLSPAARRARPAGTSRSGWFGWVGGLQSRAAGRARAAAWGRKRARCQLVLLRSAQRPDPPQTFFGAEQ
jgi:hypothetical protein